MSSWRVHWCINDCGLEIIDAETEVEARKKFLDMKLRHVLREEPHTGLCLRMEKITKRKVGGLMMDYKKVLRLIQAERENQIVSHGYSSKHDTVWVGEELAQAAAVYAMPAQKRRVEDWPFDGKFYRPELDRVDELIKAAALIVAEIERISQEG